MKIKRRAGRPVPPLFDEIYEDVCLMMELVLICNKMYAPQNARRYEELYLKLQDRLEERRKELE